jgi:hypothetical protein
MKAIPFVIGLSSLLLVGCASDNSNTSNAAASSSSTSSSGAPAGYSRTRDFEKAWIKEGFNFTGYQELVVTPTKVATDLAKDEKGRERLALIQRSIPSDLEGTLKSKRLFPNVTTGDSAQSTAAGTKTLRLDTTILEFDRGSSAARYTVGFGAGVPKVRVNGVMTDATTQEKVFEFQIEEKGDWAFTGFTGNKTLQAGASQELAEKVADFISRSQRGEKIDWRR